MAVFDRSSRLRLRRIFRRQRRQVENVTQQAENQIDVNFINRFGRLLAVRRFVITWLGLVVLVSLCVGYQTLALSTYYQTLKPVPGGTYNEGLIGNYSNANPLFATGAVDTAVSRLLFAGLLKYDSQNKLTGDLASSYRVDSTGKQYTITLKQNLIWHDGKPLTASDVAYTFHLLQNPDVNSPYLVGWKGITVTATNDRTVTFTLPNVLASFPYSLTTGIIPEHILSDIPPSQLRTNAFNTSAPVGAGPFMLSALQLSTVSDPDKAVNLIELKPFQKYAGGAPKLTSFVIHTYGGEPQLVAAFEAREINAMGTLTQVPTQISQRQDVTIDNFPSTAALMTFFKTSTGVLSDTQVRQALVQGADTAAIIKSLGYHARPVKEPILLGQLGYDAKYQQASYNQTAANTTLDKDGWTRGSDGIRSKDNQKLAFKLYAQDTSENQKVTKQLTTNWHRLGADVTVVLQPLSDFQTTLEFHTYDALLYGISVGPDPDVFAYWDSSQADIRANPRLNFSEYKSTTADTALESGRTRTDSEVRAVKYHTFLQTWQTDAPALGLYQPRLLYITRGQVYGLSEHPLNTDADRYSSVADWEIHTARVTNN